MMRALRLLTGGKRLNVAKVCSKSDKHTLLRMVNVLERGESQPDDGISEDAENSNLSMRDWTRTFY